MWSTKRFEENISDKSNRNYQKPLCNRFLGIYMSVNYYNQITLKMATTAGTITAGIKHPIHPFVVLVKFKTANLM